LSGRAIIEAVIDECIAEGARIRIGTVLAAAPDVRPDDLFFTLSRRHGYPISDSTDGRDLPAAAEGRSTVQPGE